MTRLDMERELARALGEDLRTIRRRGFQLVVPLAVFDPEPNDLQSQVFDWDRGRAMPLNKVA